MQLHKKYQMIEINLQETAIRFHPLKLKPIEGYATTENTKFENSRQFLSS